MFLFFSLFMRVCLKILDDLRECEPGSLIYRNSIDLPKLDTLEILLINDEFTSLDLTTIPEYHDLKIFGVDRGYVSIPDDNFKQTGKRLFQDIIISIKNSTNFKKEIYMEDLSFYNTTILIPNNKHIINLYCNSLTSDGYGIENFDNIIANSFYITITQEIILEKPIVLSFPVTFNNNVFEFNAYEYPMFANVTNNVLTFNNKIFVDISHYVSLSLSFFSMNCIFQYNSDFSLNSALQFYNIFSKCNVTLIGFDSIKECRMKVETMVFESDINLIGVSFPGSYYFSNIFHINAVMTIINDVNDIYFS